MGRNAEIRAFGRLAGDVLAGVVGTVRDVHRAVADRAFTAVGPAALPVRVLHDGIAGGVYAVVRHAHAVPPRVAGTAVALGAPRGQQSLSDTVPGGLALALANGIGGERLRRRHPELVLDMTVRSHGAGVAPTPNALRVAFPRATPRIALFLHGLCETEAYWSLSSRRFYGEHSTHGSRLERDLGYTAVYLRYNTGLRVSDNGRRLARLLDDLVTGWPVPVEEVSLVGHSMGGLVARSACHQAEPDGWTSLVRHVFCLATPHLGAPLEKGINVASWLLSRFTETRPLSGLLNQRSDGVKDLRFGALVEADWRDADPDEFLRDRCTEIPFLPHAAYYFIGVTLSGRHDHPLARMMGDLFVRLPSASGQGRHRRLPFPLDNGRHLGGLHHFDVLNHPEVYHQLRTWLTSAGPAEG